MATSKDVPVEVVGESEVSTVVSDFSDRSESEPEQPTVDFTSLRICVGVGRGAWAWGVGRGVER